MSAEMLLCPVCGGDQTFEFLRRGRVPVHQHLLMSAAAAARDLARGRLAMHCCPQCGFVFNAAFDQSLMCYDGEYDNSQTWSGSFDCYLDELINDLVRDRSLANCRIVEVGCGQGTFLRKLIERAGGKTVGRGFDPSYRGAAVQLDGRLQFDRRFYDERAADVPADVVVCRHVIEHVPDVAAMLRSVRQALRHSPGARVFFETPCVRWILRQRVVWDLFYEHCSLFTAESLRTAFEAAGFEVIGVKHTFGGQYLWLEARPAEQFHHVPRIAADIPELARAFGRDESRLRTAWLNTLTQLAGSGPIALWGAGAKGVTFAHLIDPDCRLIDCVVDVNPAKQGRYLPGTGHPVVDPAQLEERRVTTALVLNPNYRSEIETVLSSLSADVRLVDLMGEWVSGEW